MRTLAARTGVSAEPAPTAASGAVPEFGFLSCQDAYNRVSQPTPAEKL